MELPRQAEKRLKYIRPLVTNLGSRDENGVAQPGLLRSLTGAGRAPSWPGLRPRAARARPARQECFRGFKWLLPESKLPPPVSLARPARREHFRGFKGLLPESKLPPPVSLARPARRECFRGFKGLLPESKLPQPPAGVLSASREAGALSRI
ncbi:hypothetical protein NDU88_003965 [Pleurodeles waltl]|uniref:Uncharacterized protein n=1 Tax=Pleurodeles waltl TaxID=8319 RepID=A0AAV7NN27_PLEWA|nr:hypothetical protein NDU88_003965 [Pleurodeles waltl]